MASIGIIDNFIVQSSLLKRLIGGVFWSLVNAVSSQGLTFVLNIVIANLLGQSTFGKFGIVQSTFLTFVGVAQLATGYAANKYVAEFRHSDTAKASRIIVLFSFISTIAGCLAGLILLLSAPLISAFLRDPSLTQSFIIISFAVFFGVLNGFQMGVLSGLESYFQIARTCIITGLLNLAGCALGAWLFGLRGLIIAIAINTFLQWIIFRRILKHETNRHGILVSADGIWQERAILIKFLLPAALSGCLSMPVLWVASLMLARSQDGFNQMALYGAANTVRTLIIYLPLVLNKVMLSLLNNQKGLNDGRRYQKIFWFNVVITTAGVLVSAVIINVFGQAILGLFGKAFKAGDSILSLVLWASVFEAISLSFYQVFYAQERMWFSLWALIVPRDGALLLMAYLLIPSYGAMGLAWSSVIAWFLFLILSIFFSYRMISLGLNKDIGNQVLDVI